MDHDVKPFHDVDLVLSRLKPALNAARDVREYWRSVEQQSPQENDDWIAEREFGSRSGYYRSLEGPGGLFLGISDRTLHVRTSARWCGFLEIEPLRQVHLKAFRAIARAVGASIMVICADNDAVMDAFYLRGTVEDCRQVMQRTWGDALPSPDDIPQQLAALATKHRVIWLSELVRATEPLTPSV